MPHDIDKQCIKTIGHTDATQRVSEVKTGYATPHSNGIICLYVRISSWLGHQLSWPLFVIWFPSISRGKCQIVRNIVLDMLPHSESICHWSSYTVRVFERHPGCGCLFVSITIYSTWNFLEGRTPRLKAPLNSTITAILGITTWNILKKKKKKLLPNAGIGL